MAATETSMWDAVLPHLDSLLPNAVMLDISADQTRVDLDQRSSLVANNRSVGGSGDISHFINSISVTNLAAPTSDEFKFHFHWAPVFTFTFHDLNFNSDAAYLSDTDFQVFRTSLGYGPEISMNTALGVFYFDVTPGVAYSWVSWSSPVSGGSMAKSNFNLALSLGFYHYFSEHWALRLFVRDILEDTQVWKEALDSSQGFDVPVTRVSNWTYGLSVAWIFR